MKHIRAILEYITLFSDEDEENSSNSYKNENVEHFLKAMSEARSRATDFKLRFSGHCNTTTDIKEANFFGR